MSKRYPWPKEQKFTNDREKLKAALKRRVWRRGFDPDTFIDQNPGLEVSEDGLTFTLPYDENDLGWKGAGR